MSLFTKSYIDLDDFEDLFEDGFTVASQSETQWVFNLTSGDVAGFNVSFGGTGLTGTTFPLAGTVQSITVTNATGATVASFSGFSIPAPILASELDLAEDNDDDQGEDDDDQGGDDNDDEDAGEEDEDEANEHLYGGDDDDDMDGGDGDDDIDSGDGDDDVNGGLGADILSGGDGNDDLDGDSGDDDIDGGVGSDDVQGDRGNDDLSGGRGKDVLTGGLGQDDQDGRAGADCFDFNTLKDSVVGANHDVVTFSHLQGDKIDLSTIDADTDGTRGNQDFTWIGSKAFSGEDGQLRFSNGLLQGDVNGDGNADFEIKIIGTLKFDDIIC